MSSIPVTQTFPSIPDTHQYKLPLPPLPQVIKRNDAGAGYEAIKSDGGSTSYYLLPQGATELNDLIEHKQMSFALGNIFKACYRLGEKHGTDAIYDLNKIVYFANRLIKQAEKENNNGQ